MIPEPSTGTWYIEQPPPSAHRGRCGKVCYGSHNAADRATKALKRSGKDRKYQGYLHPYVCKDCRAWHVGHTDYED